MDVRPRTQLSREQKAAFVLIIVLGIAGLFLGFHAFGSSIRAPIDAQIARFSADRFLTPSQKEDADKEAMKTRDTDGDGLVDYDELYVFKTSPYLADSDSDGFDDRTETYSGNDPNCPVGKDCGRGEEAASPSAAVNATPPTEPDAPADYQSAEGYKDIFLDLPPEQLKAMLVQAGVPKEKLDTLTDEELKTMFREAFQQTVDTQTPTP